MNDNEREVRTYYNITQCGERGGWRQVVSVMQRICSKDIPLLILIALMAFVLRFPGLDTPNETMFDEVVHQDFVVMTLEHRPYFDIHPPFAKLLMAGVAVQFDFDHVRPKIETFQPWGDFPYVPLRRLIAFFGILLPLVVYGVGRALGYAPQKAAIPALLVCFDSALTLYSRAMLPDMILLVMNFTGVVCTLAAVNATGKKRWAFAGLAMVALGLAVSVKWTALAVTMLCVALFVRSKMWGIALCTGVIVAVVYVLSFVTFFHQFPDGGRVDPVMYSYNVPWITEVEFPKDTGLRNTLPFIYEFHQIIRRANTDAALNANVMPAASPWAWPIARSGIEFWRSDDGQREVHLIGNIFLWLFAFLVLLYEFGWAIAQFFRTKRWPFDRTETVLVAGYLFNYIPFFFVQRPMYLYHYFTSLIFLYLLLPKVLPRLGEHLGALLHNHRFPKQLLIVCIILCVMNFFLLIPLTYGLSLHH